METTINTALQNFIMGMALTAISVLVPLLIGFIIQGVRAFVAYTRSKTDDNVLRLIENTARTMVRAAEQSGLIGAIANEAASKKEFAIQQMQTFLNSQGYTNIDIATLSAAIESAVREGAHKEGFPLDFAPSAITQLEPIAALSGDTNLTADEIAVFKSFLRNLAVKAEAKAGDAGVPLKSVPNSDPLSDEAVASMKLPWHDFPQSQTK